jgi:hypothetical protein
VIIPRWIKDVKWQEQTVTINHSKAVKNSPEYDSSPLNDSYEHLLNEYYEKIKLWKFYKKQKYSKKKMSNMSNSDRVTFKRSKTTY